MRRGDAIATPQDRRNRIWFDVLLVLGFLFLLFAFVSHIGIGVSADATIKTIAIAISLGILTGASFLFTRIRWRALRKPKGTAVLDRARTDFLLTSVSILALFTVVLMVIVEILALLVFIGVITQVGEAGVRFADHFILFQTAMLLVYLMALVAREAHVSTYRPTEAAQKAALVLTPVAGVAVLLGVLLAAGLPQRFGLLTDIGVHQGVYVVTLGVLLEFMAMRIRLRLPSLWSRFKEAVDLSRRANEEIRIELQKRAMRTYLLALFFVAIMMAFAAAVMTNSIAIVNTRANLALLIFYVGLSLILLGVLAVRIIQSRQIQREKDIDQLTIDALLERKRRSPEEVFRMSIYAVAGLIAAVALLMALFTQLERMPWHQRYTTDLAILGGLFALGPFGFFYNRELKRIEAIDEKFPDFLRDIAESARAGMTLPRALVSAAKGTYGALTEDIQQMAAQVEWGVEFGVALERFAERAKTPLIDRTVSLVVEAQRAGGNVVDILTAAAEDAREIKQIVSERNEQMKMYKVVVFIAFFVFIAVVMVLTAQFIPAFKEAAGAAAGQQVGGIQFKEVDSDAFNTLFFHAAIVQAVGGGLVGGVLTRGKPVAGFASIAVMVAISWLCFRVLVGMM